MERYGQSFAYRIPECRDALGTACVFMEAHYAGHVSRERLCQCSALSRSALLRAFTRERPHSLRAKLFSAEYADLTVVDFSSLA